MIKNSMKGSCVQTFINQAHSSYSDLAEIIVTVKDITAEDSSKGKPNK
jgi:hypothetical protein